MTNCPTDGRPRTQSHNDHHEPPSHITRESSLPTPEIIPTESNRMCVWTNHGRIGRATRRIIRSIHDVFQGENDDDDDDITGDNAKQHQKWKR